MAKKELVTVYGLWTQPNPYSEAPAGALDIATNGVIDRPSIFESRRGFKQFNDPLDGVVQLLEFQDTLLAHVGDAFQYDDSGWTALAGTFEAPAADLKVQSAELTKSFYVTTSEGLVRFDAPSAAPVAAGIAPALDGTAAVSAAGGGWFADNLFVTYRIVWGRRLENGRLLLGAPSARITVENTSGTDDTVDLEFTIPADIAAGDFYQAYRSEQASTSATSDELQLVMERTIDDADVIAGTIAVTDETLETDKGAFLYTSPSQEGILQAHDRPPLMRDIVEFRQHLLGLATTQRHEVIILWQTQPAVNDTIDVGAHTFTAKATENIALLQFAIGATLVDTMRSFIRVLNRTSDNTSYYAYELSGPTMRIDVRGLTDAGFTVTASNADIFNFESLDSTQEDAPYRIHSTTASEGDAWPRLNFFDAGASQGRRLAALRDVVFAIMDNGVYRLTGTEPASFVVEVHDSTVVIKGANTAAVANNTVFMMTNRGVVALTMNELDDKIGEPIQNELLRLAQMDNWDSTAFGVAYEQDQKYFLFAPTLSDDETATQVFVLNYETRQWTRWDIAATCALERSNPNLLYVGRADTQVVEERKSFTLQDFADDEFDVNVTAASGDVVTLDSVADISVGMTLQQDNAQGVILAIDGLDVTVDRPYEAWEVAAAKVYTPIPVQMRFLRHVVGRVASYKHFAEIGFAFEDAGFAAIEATFRTDLSGGELVVPLAALGSSFGWGEFEWPEDDDDTEWGGSYGGAQTIPTYVPRDCSLATWLQVGLQLEEAFTALALSGVELTVYPTTGRVR